VKVGDLVKGLDIEDSVAAVGIVTHMSNQLGPGHAWVYVTVSWPDTGPRLENSNDIEVISESR